MVNDENPNLGYSRKIKKNKLSHLSDYRSEYTVDKFIIDLEDYFDKEVDFDISKIRQEISKAGKLKQLINKAEENNTHPVPEFIQELFSDLYKNR